jgi:uracil-DNA glycosylase
VSDRQAELDAIADELRGHVPCGFAICEEATNIVPGGGAADARVVFVGEAPGASEDRQGRAFVGSAGRLLGTLLEDAGLTREDVWVTNVVKARPPKNRDPRADEVAHYLPWLERELDVLQPDLVVPLGRHALGRFVEGVRIGEVHGQVLESPGGRRILPWYHPAAALHNQGLRATLHEDAVRLGETLRAG